MRLTSQKLNTIYLCFIHLSLHRQMFAVHLSINATFSYKKLLNNKTAVNTYLNYIPAVTPHHKTNIVFLKTQKQMIS